MSSEHPVHRSYGHARKIVPAVRPSFSPFRNILSFARASAERAADAESCDEDATDEDDDDGSADEDDVGAAADEDDDDAAADEDAVKVVVVDAESKTAAADVVAVDIVAALTSENQDFPDVLKEHHGKSFYHPTDDIIDFDIYIMYVLFICNL